MIWRQIRYPFITILIALIPLGFYNIYQNLRGQFQNIDVQADLYARSPGCTPGAENIDPALSPCTDIPVTVAGVLTHTEPSKVYAGGVTVYDLSIRDPRGNLTTYDHVSENFATGRRLGETITAHYWRGYVHKLIAGQDSYFVPDLSPQTQRSFMAIKIWIFVSLFIAPALIRVICLFWNGAYRGGFLRLGR